MMNITITEAAIDWFKKNCQSTKEAAFAFW